MTKLSREVETLIAIQGELAMLRDDMREIIGMMDKILEECAEARAERLKGKDGSLGMMGPDGKRRACGSSLDKSFYRPSPASFGWTVRLPLGGEIGPRARQRHEASTASTRPT
jgi:hypothetical protein